VKTPQVVAALLISMFLCSASVQAQEEDPKVSSQAPAEETPKASVQAQQPAPKSEEQELLKKIEELEDKLNKLTEESTARKKLQITEEEKKESEQKVLEAVGTDYTLESRHTLGLDYSFSYSYTPSEALRQTPDLEIIDQADHTLRNVISAYYGLRDNLNINASIPFVYRYTDMGASTQIDDADIGDMSIGIGYQPYKAKAGELTSTFGFSVSLPTGRSPYEINSETELSTGNGTYAFTVSGSFSKVVDPVVAFWNVSYSHRLPLSGLDHYVSSTYILEKVELGDSVGFGAGLAYAMSYKLSVNASFNYMYTRGTDYTYSNLAAKIKREDTVDAGIGFGVGWSISQKTTLSVGVSYALTGSGFAVSFRVPFSFVL